tara:strand:+ start:699 stop:2150 length:1452 start_codon:yes stop_codon:yes gene_type:complete
MANVYLEKEITIIVVLLIGFIFILIGYLNFQRFQNKVQFIVGDRDENIFSLTTTLTASALGAWVLFGPASAATFGGIGAVIGYSLGAATPMLLLYNFGPKIRNEFPKGLTLTQFIKKRFGETILKLCLFLILFYLVVFLIAEVTAIAALLNYISNIPLWLTSILTLLICLMYVLKGGFKLSLITDKYQFIFIILILVGSYFLVMHSINFSSFSIIKSNSPILISPQNINNYTIGLTMFIAVAATNLFHQGNWQRVFSAKNNLVLKKSLINSSIIVFLVVFWLGFSGIISISLNDKVIPDLAFFEIILIKSNALIIILLLILVLSLTLSTIDTLINAISSLFIIDGGKINNFFSGKDIIQKTNFTILFISLFVLIISSKGYSILYLFLLADLICCAAVITIFFAFFKKNINPKLAKYSISSGLIAGLLFFPSQNFENSILVGNLISKDFFHTIILNNLLFFSFLLSLLIPTIILYIYSLRNSLR